MISLRRKSRQHGGIFRSLFLILFFLGIVGAGAVAYLGHQEMNQPGPLTEEKVVWIKPGMGVSSIASELGQESVIHSDLVFKIAARLRGVQAQLRAGEYEVPAGASVNEVIDILLEGKPYLHKITFAEGRTTKQILVLINEDEVLDGEITLEPGEGTLLPETYAFVRGESRDDMIRRMQDAQKDLLEELWPARAEDLPVTTPEEAVILASIVEKETGLAEERPLVAGVFTNRLKRGMRLESDPTIIYGLTGGEPLGRGIRLSELNRETPYNTYKIRGLPPTPIANPGRDAIAAVLNPPETDYIFFVADGTGGHAFASTLREHNANVRRWRQIERERKGG